MTKPKDNERKIVVTLLTKKDKDDFIKKCEKNITTYQNVIRHFIKNYK